MQKDRGCRECKVTHKMYHEVWGNTWEREWERLFPKKSTLGPIKNSTHLMTFNEYSRGKK